MPVEVIMPKVDMDMASGKIMSWHIAEGDRIAKGEPLFDIETDKAAMEVEAPADGFLHHTAPEGMEIPIGTPCAWLYGEGEDVGEQPRPFAGMDGGSAPAASTAGEPEDQGTADPTPDPVQESVTSDGTDKIRATPKARRLAAQAGLDLAFIDGTGPRGRVQAQDVETALSAHETQADPYTFSGTPASFTHQSGPLSVTRSKGGTGTPIVLIHGFASDATSWAPLEAHLRHRPLIRIDLPSHGKSPKQRISGFADLVKTLRQTFDDLGLERAHLVGHSLGGAISIALADTRSRRISSLSLIAPAGLGPDINGAALSGICRASRAESLQPWLRELVANPDIITDGYTRLAMAARSDASLRAAQTGLANVLFPDAAQAFDLRAALDRLELPTRIIWGKQDAIIPWQHALRAPGHVALHLFDGIGHMPQIECADAVGGIIKPFV